jgi:hypothetical protein
VAGSHSLGRRLAPTEVSGWESWQRQNSDGAVESEQRVTLSAPVVDFSVLGAAHLGHSYWYEVERATRRFVRARRHNGGLELRVLGNGPDLLRFGQPTVHATHDLAYCSYPIEGGILAQRAAGEIIFEQIGSPPTVRSTIRGFLPSLAARRGRPDWTGALYNRVQSKIHVAISRRYFARLIAGSRQ